MPSCISNQHNHMSHLAPCQVGTFNQRRIIAMNNYTYRTASGHHKPTPRNCSKEGKPWVKFNPRRQSPACPVLNTQVPARNHNLQDATIAHIHKRLERDTGAITVHLWPDEYSIKVKDQFRRAVVEWFRNNPRVRFVDVYPADWGKL
jgi:hypothetical protein